MGIEVHVKNHKNHENKESVAQNVYVAIKRYGNFRMLSSFLIYFKSILHKYNYLKLEQSRMRYFQMIKNYPLV